MIGYDEIVALGSELAEDPRTQGEVREWLASQGVDFDGLVRYAAEIGGTVVASLEDGEGLTGQWLIDRLGATFAGGFEVGWRLLSKMIADAAERNVSAPRYIPGEDAAPC